MRFMRVVSSRNAFFLLLSGTELQLYHNYLFILLLVDIWLLPVPRGELYPPQIHMSASEHQVPWNVTCLEIGSFWR